MRTKQGVDTKMSDILHIKGRICGIKQFPKNYNILMEDGELYSEFGKAPQGLAEGLTVEFDYKQNGKFRNIVKGTLLPAVGEQINNNSFASGERLGGSQTNLNSYRTQKDRDIILQCCLKSVTDIVAAKIMTKEIKEGDNVHEALVEGTKALYKSLFESE